jgi:hypothetical protein
MPMREWNPKAFFRRISPPVLELLRAWSRTEMRLDGEGALGEQTYKAWLALPETERRGLETKLLPVNDLCSKHARPYLEGLGEKVWGSEATKRIEESRQWTAQDFAVRLFIEAEAEFRVVWRSYNLDTLEHVKEFHGRYPRQPRNDPAAKALMKAAMLEHFKKTPFAGRCNVEDFVNEEKLAIFVDHEDEHQPFDEFDAQGVVVPSWRRPLIRLAAIFHFETLTLFIKATRKDEREQLRNMFAEIIMGDPDYFEDTSKTMKFSFEPLWAPGFDFPTQAADQIDRVSVVQVAWRPGNTDVKRLVFDLKPGLSMAGVRLALQNHGVASVGPQVDGVHLRFNFLGAGPTNSRTVSLFNPNSSNLADTTRDRTIRRCLKRWGIDASGRRETLVPVHREATG